MSDITRIFVVRHGESEHNVAKLSSGIGNPQLTEKGRQQSKEAKKKLSHIQFDAVYSSPLDRALHTAKIITGKPVPPEHRLEELKERNFGSFEGKPEKYFNETRKALPHEEAWHYKQVDNMESDHELSLRYVAAIEKIAKKHPGETILISSHGGAVSTTAVKLNKPEKGHPLLVSGMIKNGDYIEIAYDGKELKVVSLNGEPL